MLVYVNNILCIPWVPDSVIRNQSPKQVLSPETRLSGNPRHLPWHQLKLMQLENGGWAWGISLSMYVREAVKNCKDYVSEHLPPQYRLPKLSPNPFPTKYEPGIDIILKLDPGQASYFQSLIGIMCWMVELGCINITTESHCYCHIQHYHVKVTWMLLCISWLI